MHDWYILECISTRQTVPSATLNNCARSRYLLPRRQAGSMFIYASLAAMNHKLSPWSGHWVGVAKPQPRTVAIANATRRTTKRVVSMNRPERQQGNDHQSRISTLLLCKGTFDQRPSAGKQRTTRQILRLNPGERRATHICAVEIHVLQLTIGKVDPPQVHPAQIGMLNSYCRAQQEPATKLPQVRQCFWSPVASTLGAEPSQICSR